MKKTKAKLRRTSKPRGGNKEAEGGCQFLRTRKTDIRGKLASSADRSLNWFGEGKERGEKEERGVRRREVERN